MDEAGHSGDSGAAKGGTGGDSRDRTLLNGWAAPRSPWSNAGAALDPEEEDVPAWRRPSAEIRPFTRQPQPPDDQSGEIRPFGESRGSGEVPRPYGDASHSGDLNAHEPPRSGNTGPSWSAGRARYSDLLAHLSPNGNQPAQQPAEPRPDSLGPDPFRPGTPPPVRPASDPFAQESPRPGFLRPDSLDSPQSNPLAPGTLRTASQQPDSFPPGPPSQRPESFASGSLGPGSQRPDSFAPGASGSLGPASQRPDSLKTDDERRTSEMRAVDAAPPSSAPPFPYEGDLDDARSRATQPPAAQQRAAVPLSRTFPAVRPATPGGRRVDWIANESARHALDPNTPPEGMPRVDTSTPESGMARASYDPSSFPRRLPYDAPSPTGSAPPTDTPSGYAAPSAYSGGFPDRPAGNPGAGRGEPISRALPQRVPAEPDVPTVPEPPSVEPPAETPALARIATHLRRGDVLSAEDRQEGFDVKAILAAVREVDGVRDASLRSTPQGAHSLRLDLAEGADPAEVSRQVARLLQDRMGLDAAMQGHATPPASGSAAVRAPATGAETPPVTPFAPTHAGSAGRSPISGGPRGAQFGPLPQNPRAGRAPETAAPAAPPTGPLSTAGPSYVAGPFPEAETLEAVPSAIDWRPPRPLDPGDRPGPRVVIENVQVNTFGTEATVEVRLAVGGTVAAGVATGPAVDGFLLRLCAMATAQAVDELLATSDHADGPARCFVEHAASVPFGPMQVAVVVLLLSCGGWVEQLAGSAVVTGDDRHAMVRATLAAVNRRLEALLS
ncbi:MAG TPA: Daple [Actinoplanes sp.]|nr:Daple [Actinoplanes sp.]